MQHTARLQGNFSNGSLLEVVQTILQLPQEGRLNVRNASDGSWGNIYHKRQLIVEVNAQTLRSDQALERIVSWSGGDYSYYALRIPDELEKQPISKNLFQTLFGSSSTTVSTGTVSTRTMAETDLKKTFRSQLLNALGPIADYLIAEVLEQTGLEFDGAAMQGSSRFYQALIEITPEAYHARVRAVIESLEPGR